MVVVVVMKVSWLTKLERELELFDCDLLGILAMLCKARQGVLDI